MTAEKNSKHMAEDPLQPHAREDTSPKQPANWAGNRPTTIRTTSSREDPNGMLHYDIPHRPVSVPEAMHANAESFRREQHKQNVFTVVAIVIALVAFVLGAYIFVGPDLFSSSSGDSGGTSQQEQQTDGTAQTTDTVAATGSTQIDICMVGDVLLQESVIATAENSDGSYDFTHIFENTASETSSYDLAMLDQETVLGGTEFGIQDSSLFNSPQEAGDAEVAAGYDVILHANNHVMDMGYEGLHSELEFWRTNHPEISVLGVIDPLSDDPGSLDDIYVYEKDGVRVAILNYTYGLNVDSDTEGAVALLEEEKIRTDCETANSLADIVIVCPHWGTANTLEPDDDQRQWAQLFLECGVDVVIGCHTHTVQPIEVLTDDDGHQMVCFWSIGNFISDMSRKVNMVGGIARVRIVRDSDGTVRVSGYGLTPVVTHKDTDDETTYLLSDYTDELAETNELSSVTPEYCQGLLSDTLGSDYDTETCELWVDL